MRKKSIYMLLNILGMLFISAYSYGTDVSVKDFGAKGDGKTDDRLAIQAAIDAVGKSGGGTVSFPEGIYMVTAPNRGRHSLAQITVANGVTLKGSGKDRSIIKVADDQGAWFELFGGSGIKDFTMYNLSIDANGTANKCIPNKPGGIGDDCAHILVRLPASTNVTIRKCHFFNHSGVWIINCSGGVTNFVLDSCILDRVGGFSADFDHSTIYTTGDGPVLVSNNVFMSKDGPGTTGARTAMEMHGSNQRVINNKISGFRYGINMCTGHGPGTKAGPTVNQEYIGNTVTGIGAAFIFWSMSSDGFDNMIIADNTVEVDVQGWKNMYAGEHRGMFQTSAARGPVKNLVIRHNNLSYTGSEGYGRNNDLHVGMWLGAAPWSKTEMPLSKLTVEDNTIKNSTSAAIVLSSTVEDAKITGNTIINPGRASDKLSEMYATAICLSGKMKNVICAKNTFIDDQAVNTMKTGIWEETTNQGGCISSKNKLKIKSKAKVNPFRVNPKQSGAQWTTKR